MLAATAVALCLMPQLSRFESLQPNILLVSIDTLRSDHLHCYGYERETSPNIDALAAGGVRFSQMVSSSSWTLPAHVTLLTGIPPHHHGVVVDETRLDPRVTTLAEVMREEGYQTAGFVSVAYLLPRYGFEQGFETYDYSIAIDNQAINAVTSPVMEKLTTEWLSQRSGEDRQKPFFVFLHLYDVHFDFIPPEPFDQMFNPDYDGPVDGRDFVDSDLYNPDMDPRDYEQLLSLYDGEIRLTDHHLGRVLDHLRTSGELDNTIVVVTGDHGEEFFEHGRKGHRMTLFEEVVRVPLIIRYPPRIPAGTVVDDQVRLMDVSATILDLAGVDPPSEFGMRLDDVRFCPLNLMTRVEQRPNVPDVASYGELHDTIFSIRMPTLKFVYHPDRDYGELFDLETDPSEQNNLYYEKPEESAVLKEKIRSFREGNRGSRSAQPHEMDEEQIKRLRSLGYIQ
jgi:arylsulfatase A-like enzyme